MTLRRPSPRALELMTWVGVLGAGLSWAAMFLFGFGLSVGTCNQFTSGGVPGFNRNPGIPFDTWTLVATAIGAALAILSIVAAITTFRMSRDGDRELTSDELIGKGSPPPRGRRHFLAIIGVTVSPLFLFIILLSGLGSFVLTSCQQS